MYNRYQGNTGQVRRVQESHDRQPQDSQRRDRPSPPPERGGGHAPNAPPSAPQQPRRGAPAARQKGLLEQLGQLLPGTQEPLETEDVILLLILYLMYRESGDSELLMIMGAMFLL